VGGHAGFHSIERHPSARREPGLVLFRFNGPIVFFSADYFRREVLKAAAEAGPDLRWFVVDMLPVSMVDATGLHAIEAVSEALRERGVAFGAAARAAEWAQWAAERGFDTAFRGTRFFTTLRQAVQAFRDERAAAATTVPAPG
jgi:MFS superfamily sulfate permease-like transporter